MRNRRSSIDLSLEEKGVDLTPLIDVVFVVLILFILIAPMLEIDKIQLANGPHKEQSSAYGQDQPLVIKVTGDNAVLVNQLPIAVDNLPRLFQALYAQNPQVTPQLLQDKTSHFGTYQTIKNALEEAGFRNLDVILSP